MYNGGKYIRRQNIVIHIHLIKKIFGQLNRTQTQAFLYKSTDYNLNLKCMCVCCVCLGNCATCFIMQINRSTLTRRRCTN